MKVVKQLGGVLAACFYGIAGFYYLLASPPLHYIGYERMELAPNNNNSVYVPGT
jgi:hypothetical protein